jgi:hypothetical protein
MASMRYLAALASTGLGWLFIHFRAIAMNLHLSLTPLISLLAGILILVMPKLLNFIVAIYLIAVGLIGIFGLSTFNIR